MNIALGYRWFETALGYHVHRAFTTQGHAVTYVGLATESRPGYGETTSILEICKSLNPRPDLFIWIDPAGRYFPRDIELLDLPTACYLVDVHLGHWREQVARFFDVVFVAQKNAVQRYRDVVGHRQVFWLPLAAAPDVHYDHNVERIYDVGFVGNMIREHVQSGRARRLTLIAERFSTNNLNRSYTPEEVGLVYSQSKIVFNTSIAGDITMRLFEGTACGAMMLTDQTDNGLGELFDPISEVATFQDDADLIRKIETYLADDARRILVAGAGQARTLAQHLYPHRAEQMLAQIGTAGRIAPMRTAGPADKLSARRTIYTHLHMLDALFDDARQAGLSPIRKAQHALPGLTRRVIR